MAATFDFSAQNITSQTLKEWTFDLIPGSPGIMSAPLHDQNRECQAERLRMSIERAANMVKQSKRKPVEPTADGLMADEDRDRDDDKVLIARTCAKAWTKAPVAVDGSAPEFSEENCLAFLRALPNYMFDPFRNFLTNIANFVPELPLDEKDAEAAGN